MLIYRKMLNVLFMEKLLNVIISKIRYFMEFIIYKQVFRKYLFIGITMLNLLVL